VDDDVGEDGRARLRLAADEHFPLPGQVETDPVIGAACLLP
jgi:hypothetical protein